MYSSLFHLIPPFLAAPPTPEQFWAVMVWGVIPAVAGIWLVYLHHQERLRRVHRRLRQLEARLACLTHNPLPSPPHSATAVPLQPVPKSPQPSALTARIFHPPASEKVRSYTQPIAGPLS